MPRRCVIGDGLEPWVMGDVGDSYRAFATFTPYRRRMGLSHPFLIRLPMKALTLGKFALLLGAREKSSQVT